MQLTDRCESRLLAKTGQESNQQGTVYVNMYRNIESCFNESEIFSLNPKDLTLTDNCSPDLQITIFPQPM